MLRFYADQLAELMNNISSMENILSQRSQILLQPFARELVPSRLEWFIGQCTEMKLQATRKKAQSLLFALQNPDEENLDVHAKIISNFIAEMKDRFADEVEGKVIFFF